MSKSKKLYSFVTLFIAGLLFVFILTALVTQRYWFQRLDQQVSSEAVNVSQYFNKQLERYQHIPDLLTSHYQIRQVLKQETQTYALSKILLDIQKTSGASDVYVLDTHGDVIASSNFQSAKSYIGSNYAFRPYFYQAMQGNRWTDYALGLRSGERGIFFSAPIYADNEIIGVIAVKVDIDKFEQDTEWLAGSNSAKFMVYGKDEVVFISNHPYWRLKQLRESDYYTWSEIQATHRYLDLQQQRLSNAITSTPYLDKSVWQIESSSQRHEQYVYGKAKLPLLDLDFVMLLPVSEARDKVQVSLILSSLAYTLLVTVMVFVFRRVAGYRQLIFTRNALESEVVQRTQQLESAHQALVQSAKLATIGQLSASVNHEINQPLSAMSTYLVASKRMLAKGMLDEAQQNMVNIESLIARVHKTVSQLKQFSRPSEHRLDWCQWQSCLNNALIVVGPKINSSGVILEAEPHSVLIWGDPLKLEQVLVNLLSNAVEAMQECNRRYISIRFEQDGELELITISDTGTGLDLHAIESIFEPFYSTKSDNGLGLGLAISRSIIQSFGGELLAANNDAHQGAKFTLRLKRKPHADHN
ncbi:sensor histidine kinase [Vibrio hepatarius]|uniref:sensor histidine kinase n=1 Tax=Vibrio hepatarius TaxID=171383 RepID=UPI00142DBBA3|nr:ATP-binding protein [Vibrio hepatarius]NIY83895.1 sensor histidine kinase [Vibrio hepatarius]